MNYDLSALLDAFLRWSGIVAWTALIVCVCVELLKRTRFGK